MFLLFKLAARPDDRMAVLQIECEIDVGEGVRVGFIVLQVNGFMSVCFHGIIECMKTPVLETERLILRPVTLDDTPAIQKYFNNWEIVQHLSAAIPWPYPDDGAETFLKDNVMPRVAKGDAHVWALTLKENDECIGLLDFGTSAEENAAGNRGFWLAEHLHGKGYMTEAVSAVNDFVFSVLKIPSFMVVNAKVNSRSRRVKEKTGARFIRTVSLLHHNGETESELWEVTRENWEKVRNK